jgi:capsular polysaccharide transport system permease protein
LNKTVRNEKLLVTGDSHSLSAKSASYDRFLLEKGFADRQLATALVSLESAKSEAVRKQLYLERLVQPNLPDKAMEPRRLRSVLTVLLLGLIAWGVISLLVASVKEHTE